MYRIGKNDFLTLKTDSIVSDQLDWPVVTASAAVTTIGHFTLHPCRGPKIVLIGIYCIFLWGIQIFKNFFCSIEKKFAARPFSKSLKFEFWGPYMAKKINIFKKPRSFLKSWEKIRWFEKKNCPEKPIFGRFWKIGFLAKT